MNLKQSIALVVALSVATTAPFAAPPKPNPRGDVSILLAHSGPGRTTSASGQNSPVLR